MLVTCGDGTDCPSEVCLPDGVCGASDSIVYVDNAGGACSGTHAGTQMDPVCTLDDGIVVAKAKGKQRIHVEGSALGYAGTTIDGLTLSIFGPGGYATPAALVSGQIDVTGAAKVLIDGLEMATAGGDLLLCNSTAGTMPTLEVTRSYLHNGQGVGAHGNRCKLTIRRSVLAENGQGGVLSEGGGDLLVENSFIAANRGTGVRAADGGALVQFCTIVANGSVISDASGGVDCGTGSGRSVVGTLLYLNAKPLAGGTQVSSSCKMTDSATDDSSFPNGSNNHFKAKPDFVSMTDLHLRRGTGSNACCIDQIATSTVKVDYDGTPRPQGPKWDIGATEVK